MSINETAREKAEKQCVALVNNPPPPIQNQPIAVGLCISLGLAQFLTEVEMTEHAQFDGESEDHIKLLKEFTDLKNIIRKEIEPVMHLKVMLEVMSEIAGDDAVSELMREIEQEIRNGTA